MHEKILRRTIQFYQNPPPFSNRNAWIFIFRTTLWREGNYAGGVVERGKKTRSPLEGENGGPGIESIDRGRGLPRCETGGLLTPL